MSWNCHHIQRVRRPRSSHESFPAPAALLGRTNPLFAQRTAAVCCTSAVTQAAHLGIISLAHLHKQISLQIFPSKQHGPASSIILTLSVLPLTAQDVLSSQFAGNVKRIMAIYDVFMYSTAGRRRGGPPALEVPSVNWQFRRGSVTDSLSR